MDQITVNIKTACDISHIGRSTLYKLLSSGAIKSAKIGKKRLVLVASLREFLTRPAEGITPASRDAQ